MRPVLVIIADVLVHQTFQMPLVQDNHMIEQITAAVADPTFGNAILPRTSKAGSLGLDTAPVLDPTGQRSDITAGNWCAGAGRMDVW
jgi:hypothetical protein